jgi:hypothetical protein
MNDMKDTAFRLQNFAELPEEITAQVEHKPSLRRVLKDLGPLPNAALFRGVADDELPVLLNLGDPVPGPVLVAGDSGSGKTRLLHVIAEAITHSHDPDTLRFAVIAEQPDEWEGLSSSPNCEGILSFREPLTANYVGSLVNWGHSNKRSGEFVVLLIDGVEGLQADESLHQSLRWLLLRGPARRIWPIATVKATRASAFAQWLPSFRTRLCGHIASDRDLTPLVGASDCSFNGLSSGTQFAMREGKGWLPFWLPRTD